MLIGIVKKILKYIFRPTLERALTSTITFFLSQLLAYGVDNYIREFCDLIQKENPDSWKYYLALIVELVYADFNLFALIGSGAIIILLSILIWRKQSELKKLRVFNSRSEATEALGEGRQFRYAEANTDGVPSPNNSVIGIT